MAVAVERWVVTLIAVLLLAIGVLLVMVSGGFDRWKAWCESQGGHVLSRSSTVVTGTGGVGIATTYYCLTADGRVLDIR